MKLFLSISFLFICLNLFSQNTLNLFLSSDPGEKYLFEVSETSDTEQIVMGEEQQIIQRDTYSVILNVDSVSEDKSIHFKATYKHFRSEFERDNYTEYFDTDSIQNGDDPQAGYFKSLTGRSFCFSVNEKGKILSFRGLQEVFKSDGNIEIDSSSILMLQKKYGSESIKNNLFTLNYPEEDSVRICFHDTISSGILNIFDRKFASGKDLVDSVEIKYSANIITDPETSLKTGNVYISYELRGKLTGVIITDKRSGFPKNYQCKQYITGSAGMRYSINSDQAYTWPIKITNTITSSVTKLSTR